MLDNRILRSFPLKSKFKQEIRSQLGSCGHSIGDGLIRVTLEVTYDALPNPPYDRLPQTTKDEFEAIFNALKTDPGGQIPKLIKLIEKHPQIHTLRNWLIVAYNLRGEREKAKEVAEWLVQNRKDYFFGPILLAQIHLNEGDLTKAGELLGGNFKHIHAIAPGRESFHISEVEGFFHALGRYSCLSEDYRTAKHCRAILKDFAPEGNGYKQLKRMLSFRSRLLTKIALKTGVIRKTPPEKE